MAWVRRYEGARSRSYQVHWRDHAGHHSETFRLKRDAEAKQRSVESAKDRGENTDPSAGKVTLTEFWPRFLQASPHLRPSTRAGYEALWRNHIEPRLGSRSIRRITRLDVESMVAEMKSQGIGAATIGAAHRLLRRILAAAMLAGMITTNPASRVEVPRSKRDEMRFLSPQEIEAIAEAAPERYTAMILLMGFCGLRVGEATALRVKSLDFLRRKVHITEATTEVGGRLHFGEPKTDESKRAVALPPFIVDALAAHLAMFSAAPDGLVFSTSKGNPIHRTTFRRRIWVPALKAAKIAEPLPRVHDLRHSAVAIMIQANGHPKQIQAQLGHGSIEVTLGRYGHLFPSLADDLAADIDKVRAQGLHKSSKRVRSPAARRHPIHPV